MGTGGPASGTTIRLVDGDDPRPHPDRGMPEEGAGSTCPPRRPPSYSFADGILRRTLWTTSSAGVSGRFGGATLTLGNHPMADELRSLGLPKRALFSSSASLMTASFGRRKS